MWTSRQPRAGPAPEGLPGPAASRLAEEQDTGAALTQRPVSWRDRNSARRSRGQVAQASVGRAWGHLLALPLTCSGTVGKLLTLSVPQFFHLKNPL